MQQLLRDLRVLLRHEIEVAGPYVPLDSTAGAGLTSYSSGNASDMSAQHQDLFSQKKNAAEDPSQRPSRRIEALIPEEHPVAKIDALDELRAFVEENILIDIDEQRTNAVFGVGDPDANLLVIGEAPGANEDKMGKPFVGRAGKLLDKILKAIHFDRDEIYITNILKSRPPKNRNPKPHEIDAHIPILYKQIALIQPKIMLCVGKVAGNTMLDRRSSLSNLRNEVHDFYGLPLMVTYHPAALLRNPNWKRPTWEDVQLLRTRYDEIIGAEEETGRPMS